MWLTRDQQGYWLLRWGENLAASQRFESSLGRGLALYRMSRFRQAATELQALDTFEAKFLEGNAWAHSRDYRQALLAYDEALRLEPDHPEVLHNIQQIESLLELAAEQGESQQADMGDVVTFETEQAQDEEASMSDQELVMLETIEADRLLSDPEALKRWRARVESSPQRFLANRFRQEWLEQQRKDTPND
jgi:Ca-activated chloride channel family protein